VFEFERLSFWEAQVYQRCLFPMGDKIFRVTSISLSDEVVLCVTRYVSVRLRGLLFPAERFLNPPSDPFFSLQGVERDKPCVLPSSPSLPLVLLNWSTNPRVPFPSLTALSERRRA